MGIMTQHNNFFWILLITFFFISCKNDKDTKTHEYIKNSIEKNIDSIDENLKSNYTTWYPSSDLNNTEYEELEIYLNRDSIKVMKANKIICKDEIVTELLTFEKYFKSKKNSIEIKEKLLSQYKLNVSDKIVAIINADGDISNKGCQFPFGDIFIIDNHLFFYDNGYNCFLLVKNSNSVDISIIENPLQKSNIILPYNKKIDINTVEYKVINVNLIKGLEDFSCGDNLVRYFPLASKEQISLILVPQDCADFQYRFYLLSVSNNKIISNLYVEGEWFEPENYLNKEITSFELSKDFNIMITTLTNNGGKKIEYFSITNEGFFKKKL
ncbi:hypothetical protein FLGE108171_15205 [Flavobacterium gelidilacus]